MAQAHSQIAINRAASRVLTGGFMVSAVLVLAGLALTAARGDSLQTSLESVPDLLDEVARGRGAGIVGLGILAMVVTPLVSTIAIIAACIRAGDRRYALITTAVLIILALSAAISAL
jgi:uncharacterized membrane protein